MTICGFQVFTRFLCTFWEIAGGKKDWVIGASNNKICPGINVYGLLFSVYRQISYCQLRKGSANSFPGSKKNNFNVALLLHSIQNVL